MSYSAAPQMCGPLFERRGERGRLLAHVCFDGEALRIDGIRQGAVLIQPLKRGVWVRMTRREGGPFVFDRSLGHTTLAGELFREMYDTAKALGIDGLRLIARKATLALAHPGFAP